MRVLTEYQTDTLKELINIGVGRAASLLNEMIGFQILLNVPFIEVLTPFALQQELIKRFQDEHLAIVRLGFSGSLHGSAELLFPTDSASSLVSVLTGEDLGSPDLDAVKIGTLSEVGNIVLNGVMGSISNVLQQHMNYSLPIYLEDSVESLTSSSDPAETAILLGQANFIIKQLEIIGDILLIFELQTFDALIQVIEELEQ